MKIKALYFAIAALALMLPSCVTKPLKECRDESTKLNNDLQDRIKYIEAIEQKSGADIRSLPTLQTHKKKHDSRQAATA